MMRYLTLKRRGLLLILIFSLIVPSVCAYWDPGTGSMVLQVLLGCLAGALVSVKIYWKRIKGKLTKVFSKSDNLEK